ncbi:MAG: toll/interleukin-1 receptor domain-containing protein [Alphaproteobacteria bacterium]|nr:toll/interleukin-1 receptor domain-containing protein [Alphaproteobacteria bacterium]
MPARLARKVSATVFVSHPWEIAEVEAYVDGFIELLQMKLRHPPATWRDKFDVSVWFDRKNIYGYQTFSAQTDAACATAPVAVFLISSRWFASEGCQREARFFHTPTGADKAGKRYFLMQLSGQRDPDERRFQTRPHYPEHAGTGHRNLIELWDSSPSDRDLTIGCLAHDIFAALDDLRVGRRRTTP